MWVALRRWLVVLLLVGLASPAPGQDNPIMKPPSAPAVEGPAGGERPSHAFAWFIALVSTLVVMLIVCAPSRKG